MAASGSALTVLRHNPVPALGAGSRRRTALTTVTISYQPAASAAVDGVPFDVPADLTVYVPADETYSKEEVYRSVECVLTRSATAFLLPDDPPVLMWVEGLDPSDAATWPLAVGLLGEELWQLCRQVAERGEAVEDVVEVSSAPWEDDPELLPDLLAMARAERVKPMPPSKADAAEAEAKLFALFDTPAWRERIEPMLIAAVMRPDEDENHDGSTR